jgi:hypothetical protein
VKINDAVLLLFPVWVAAKFFEESCLMALFFVIFNDKTALSTGALLFLKMLAEEDTKSAVYMV